MFSIGEIIDLAIQIEKNGERIYRNALHITPASSLATWFQKLADEESQHAKWFSEMKPTVKKSADELELEEMGRSILGRILGDQSFSLQDADFSSIDQVRDLLELAIEFERDTVLFYEMIHALIEEEDTEALNVLEKIIDEENRHIQLFRDLLESGEANL